MNNKKLAKQIHFEYLKVSKEITASLCRVERKLKEKGTKNIEKKDRER